ncbi:hypothetical protein Slala02_29300 [Streptomyces lavendulae subsp. lavendulae]|nr:hypothetical protein Slala01_32590 [Streptomyces lavendulae subsp. lavendulae]GLX27110.1 hypothetical protein Slala02_29300 [Streptomyces lavendulae subsp. lavendulae]
MPAGACAVGVPVLPGIGGAAVAVAARGVVSGGVSAAINPSLYWCGVRAAPGRARCERGVNCEEETRAGGKGSMVLA